MAGSRGPFTFTCIIILILFVLSLAFAEDEVAAYDAAFERPMRSASRWPGAPHKSGRRRRRSVKSDGPQKSKEPDGHSINRGNGKSNEAASQALVGDEDTGDDEVSLTRILATSASELLQSSDNGGNNRRRGAFRGKGEGGGGWSRTLGSSRMSSMNRGSSNE